MTGDAPSEGGGGTGGGLVNAAITFGASFLGSRLGGAGFGGTGIRSVLQSQQAIEQAQLRDLEVANKLAFAREQLTGFVPSEHAYLKVTPVITPQVKRLGESLAKLQASRKRHPVAERVIAQQLQTARAVALPQASFTYVARYGLNNGPPVAGSRDDPRSGRYY